MQIDQLYIEITDHCNLNCSTCYNASGTHSKTTEISPEALEEFLKKATNKYQITGIMISGGEPILHSRFDEILDVLESYPSYSYLILTNGTIRHKRLYHLVETKKNFTIHFSLDGADAAANDQNRGKGNFDRTINNLKTIKPGSEIYLKMVISQYNLHQVEEYFKLAIQLGCKPSFAFANYLGNARTNWQDFILDEYQKNAVNRLLTKLSDDYKTEANNPQALYDCSLLDNGKPIYAAIKPNGSIQPCQLLYDDEFSIGSIYNPDFDDIEKRFGSLREKILERSHMDFGCSKCINQFFCHKGCPAAAYNLNHDIMSPDGSCAFRRLQTAKITIPEHLHSR